MKNTRNQDPIPSPASASRSGQIPPWPEAVPQLRESTNPVLAQACRAAAQAVHQAWAQYDRQQLAASQGMGADGTPTMLIDELVDEAVMAVAQSHGVNLVSEEVGFIDRGSARTLVVDPLDGSANAAAGVPLSCFSGVLVDDGTPVEALTCWLETGRTLQAVTGEKTLYRTSGATTLAGSALSMLRPKDGPLGNTMALWSHLADRADRVRILSSSCLEAMLVADGSIDAFVDPGSETHRLVDLYAAAIFVPAAGGAVCDAYGRPIEFSTDQTKRYSGVVASTPQLAAELADLISSQLPQPHAFSKTAG